MTGFKKICVRTVAILLLVLTAVPILGAVSPGAYAGDLGVELTKCLGDSTMRELTLYWDAYGLTEGIGNAARSNHFYSGNTEAADYRVIADKEQWSVGISCTEEEAIAYLEPLLSNKCEIYFYQAEYTREELRETYIDVVKDYHYDLAVDDIWMEQNRICVEVSNLSYLVYYKLYEVRAEKKYGDMVKLVSINGSHYDFGATIDMLGRDTVYYYNQEDMDFVIFLLAAVLLTLILPILWIIFRKRVRQCLPKLWMRLLLVPAYILLLALAYEVTGRITAPPIEERYAQFILPCDGEAKIVERKSPRKQKYAVTNYEPTEAQIEDKMREMILTGIPKDPIDGFETAAAKEGDIVSFYRITSWRGRILDVARGIRTVGLDDGENSVLLGAKIGDNRFVSYEQADPNGGFVSFDVELIVTGILETVDIEMTDEFVRDYSDYESLAELRTAAEEKLRANIDELSHEVTGIGMLARSLGETYLISSYDKRVRYLELRERCDLQGREEEDNFLYNIAEHEIRYDLETKAYIEKFLITASETEKEEKGWEGGIFGYEVRENEYLNKCLEEQVLNEKVIEQVYKYGRRIDS